MTNSINLIWWKHLTISIKPYDIQFQSHMSSVSLQTSSKFSIENWPTASTSLAIPGKYCFWCSIWLKYWINKTIQHLILFLIYFQILDFEQTYILLGNNFNLYSQIKDGWILCGFCFWGIIILLSLYVGMVYSCIPCIQYCIMATWPHVLCTNCANKVSMYQS